jgi:uncharacterized damage-inducible protein DinB
MSPTDLTALVDYHYWARDRVLAAVEPLTTEECSRDLCNSFRSILATLVHLYGAEWVWHARWLGTSPPALPGIDMLQDLAAVKTAWLDIEPKVRSFVNGLSEDALNRHFDYTLFSGKAGRSRIGHSIQHVVNHASYHRGQITTMLRQLGHAAPAQDLIAFYRERGI